MSTIKRLKRYVEHGDGGWAEIYGDIFDLLVLVEEMAGAFRVIEHEKQSADYLVSIFYRTDYKKRIIDDPYYKALNGAVETAQSALTEYKKMKGE